MWYSATSGHVRTEVTSSRTSKKLKKFIIILDNDTLLYLPGSFLSGSVLVELENDTPVLVSWWHGGTLSSRRAASPLVRWVEGEERWEAPDHPQGFLSQNWGETELNHSVTCRVLKATDNDRCYLALCHDECGW
ncbi:uncharacterized protein TNCV_2499921 [Trichonephila clavipes]|nr:uncharacterized protein TNCV_2499921 [Trichonephila clavipes]